MSTVAEFVELVKKSGSLVTFHRDDSATPCPCLTPEGFRDPAWHINQTQPTTTVDGDQSIVQGHPYLVVVSTENFPPAETICLLDWNRQPGNIGETEIRLTAQEPAFFIHWADNGFAGDTEIDVADGAVVTQENWTEPPLCNENGMLTEAVEIAVKAFVQPAQSTRATRLSDEFMTQMFGLVEADDHIGIFPESWEGTPLNFFNWTEHGADYIVYNGRKFLVVNANLIPDPSDGNPRHHWECGLRIIS